MELGNRESGDLKEGEGVRQTEQGVRGAAQGVGDGVPGQETRLRGAGGGLVLHRLHGTLDDVKAQSKNTNFISYLHS